MISKVHVFGLGAIGSVYAARIYDSNPEAVRIIASYDRIERYKKEGVHVNGKKYDFSYCDHGSSNVGKAELILIAVKQHHLMECINSFLPFVGDDTIILSLLNGISSEEIIGERTGMDRMLYSYVVGTDATRESRSTKYKSMGRIVFGEKDNTEHSANVKKVSGFFDRYGINYEIPVNMLRSMWWKFMLNVAVNQLSAVLDAPYGVFAKSSYAQKLLICAAQEVVDISKKNGVDLNHEDIELMIKIICGLDPESMTSMLQDVRAGRKTEVEIFSKEVLSLGRQYGVNTPVNDLLYSMIKVIEDKNI